MKKLIATFKISLIFFLSNSASSSLIGQSVIDQRISIKVENKTLVEILFMLEREHDVTFKFNPEDLSYYPRTKTYKEKQLWDVLGDLLNGTSLKALPHEENTIILINAKKLSRTKMDTLVARWDRGLYAYPFDNRNKIINLSYGSADMAFNGTGKYSITLKDKSAGFPIIGSVVKNENASINGITDLEGKITLDVSYGSHILYLSYTGYQTIELNLELYKDAEQELAIDVQSFLLDEVQIVANTSRQKMEEGKAGMEILNIAKLEVVPQALGEIDIIKSLELLPGVTSVGELSSGFNVRGGNIDESLVLLNDGIIFNPTHVIGFISAFNGDALKTASLFKGYVDPEYGNRSSAVLDLRTTANKKNKIVGKGGVGTSVLRLMLEGPVNDKISFLVSGRGSFSDWLLDQVPNIEIQNSSAKFYDLNASFKYEFSDNQRIELHAYNSDDFFQYNEEFGFEWNNLHLGAQWYGRWKDKWFSKVSINYGQYKNRQFVNGSILGSSFSTDLSYLKAIGVITRSLSDKASIKGGVELIDYNLRPDKLIALEESLVTPGENQRKGSMALSPFIMSSYKVRENLTLEGGVRISNYYSKGPGKIFSYTEGNRDESSISGVENLKGRDNSGAYSFLEPRVSFNYKPNSDFAIKGGYNRLTQNAQLVTFSNTALPTDFWMFSDRHIKPQEVQQISLGIFHNDGDNRYNISVEAFYKKVLNAQVLKDFPEVVLNEHLETELLDAKGKSYGVEFLTEKTKGKITGTIAYTFTKTTRQTTSLYGSVNRGEVFNADFDIPHQLNTFLTYKWLPSFSLNLSYVYKSGRPITKPVASFLQDNFVIPLYSQRNQGRISSYQRVDFSMIFDLRNNKKDGFRSSFTFGMYNVLGRRNAYNIFYRRSETGNINPFQFAIIGAMIPSLTWNFVF